MEQTFFIEYPVMGSYLFAGPRNERFIVSELYYWPLLERGSQILWESKVSPELWPQLFVDFVSDEGPWAVDSPVVELPGLSATIDLLEEAVKDTKLPEPDPAKNPELHFSTEGVLERTLGALRRWSLEQDTFLFQCLP